MKIIIGYDTIINFDIVGTPEDIYFASVTYGSEEINLTQETIDLLLLCISSNDASYLKSKDDLQIVGAYILLSECIADVVKFTKNDILINRLIYKIYRNKLLDIIKDINKLFENLYKNGSYSSIVLKTNGLYNRLVSSGLLPGLELITEFDTIEIGLNKYINRLKSVGLPKILIICSKDITGYLRLIHDIVIGVRI